MYAMLSFYDPLNLLNVKNKACVKGLDCTNFILEVFAWLVIAS